MSEFATHSPHFIADNLALYFINSSFGVGEERHDSLTGDASVVSWLKATVGLPGDFDEVPGGQAELAGALRETVAQMVDVVKAGEPGDPTLVNQLLEAGGPVKGFVWDDHQACFMLIERRRDHSPASLLDPAATALAALFSGNDLRYVRQCESHKRTLSFLEISKPHSRRWYSMAVSGNRMKVATFCSRKHAD